MSYNLKYKGSKIDEILENADSDHSKVEEIGLDLYEYGDNIDTLHNSGAITNREINSYGWIELRAYNESESRNYTFYVDAKKDDVYQITFKLKFSDSSVKKITFNKITHIYKLWNTTNLGWINFGTGKASDYSETVDVTLDSDNIATIVGSFSFNDDYGTDSYIWASNIKLWDSSGSAISSGVTLLSADSQICRYNKDSISVRLSNCETGIEGCNDSIEGALNDIDSLESKLNEYGDNIDTLHGSGAITNKEINSYGWMTVRGLSDSTRTYIFNADANKDNVYKITFKLKFSDSSVKKITFNKITYIHKPWVYTNLGWINFGVGKASDYSETVDVTLDSDNVATIDGTFSFNDDYGTGDYQWSTEIQLLDENGSVITSGVTLLEADSQIFLFLADSIPASIESIKSNVNSINIKIDGKDVIKSSISSPITTPLYVKTLIDASDLADTDYRKTYVALGLDVIWDSDNSCYRMFLAGYNKDEVGYAQIGMMHSTDMLNWIDDGVVLSPTGVDGDADKGSVTFPQLIKFKNEWIMFYVGFDVDGFENGIHKICYATTTDFSTWTRHGAILSREDFVRDGIWDETSLETSKGVIYRPRVRNFNGKYYMFINGGPDGDAIGEQAENIYVAVSDHPTKGWKVMEKILDPTEIDPSGSYHICSDPDVIDLGGKYLMTYWGTGNYKFLIAGKDEMPYTWHFLDIKPSWTALRQVLVPTSDNLFVFVNYGGADKLAVYMSDWVE